MLQMSSGFALSQAWMWSPSLGITARSSLAASRRRIRAWHLAVARARVQQHWPGTHGRCLRGAAPLTLTIRALTVDEVRAHSIDAGEVVDQLTPAPDGAICCPCAILPRPPRASRGYAFSCTPTPKLPRSSISRPTPGKRSSRGLGQRADGNSMRVPATAHGRPPASNTRL